MEVFDTTTQKTMLWLKEIDTELGWEHRHRSYEALRGCLQLVRDHLAVDEMAHLGAQLPMLVRGMYYEGWDPSHAPRGRSADDFVNALLEFVPYQADYNYEAMARACLGVMSRHLDPGIVRHVRGSLPEGIRELWPES
jgi:uncharacterized protein (DUF2267 family)